MTDVSSPDTSFAHASIEVGHLDPEDFMRGARHLQNRLRQTAPWLTQVSAVCRGEADDAPVSTCFMIDDYTSSIRTPSEVVPRLLDAARDCGIGIDYIVRESAFADDEHSVARSMGDGLHQQFLNIRQDEDLCITSVTLSDRHEQSPVNTPQSIFLATELWADTATTRKWSCAFLAAVWQLARLGLLDDKSQTYLSPQVLDLSSDLSRWQYLPPVIKLNRAAAPFQAYRTVSMLGVRYLTVEAAVRAILKRISIHPDILQRATECGRREGIALPPGVAERISYIFVGK